MKFKFALYFQSILLNYSILFLIIIDILSLIPIYTPDIFNIFFYFIHIFFSLNYKIYSVSFFFPSNDHRSIWWDKQSIWQYSLHLMGFVIFFILIHLIGFTTFLFLIMIYVLSLILINPFRLFLHLIRTFLPFS